jgi:hypothetical protein
MDACQTINNLCHNFITSDLLKDELQFKTLFINLKENKEIDFRKLDLYHNITQVELLKYLTTNILIFPYNDKTIIDNSDGSYLHHCVYKIRLDQLDKLQNDVYNNKFKNVPKNIKDEIFKKPFEELYQIINETQRKNSDFAHLKIKADFYKYKHEIHKSLEDRIQIFKEKLCGIDYNVSCFYNKFMEKEYENYCLVIVEINEFNSKQIKLIESLIQAYDIESQYKQKLEDYIYESRDYSRLENIEYIIYYINKIYFRRH